MIPTIEEVEGYLASLEELVYSTLTAATPGLPNLNDAAQQLWLDVSRYGPSSLPSFSEVRQRTIREFHVPPPPSPTIRQSLAKRAGGWVKNHPWTTIGVVVGTAVGASLLVGYHRERLYQARAMRISMREPRERRQVVVVLGGDHPLALPLIKALEMKGYIVIVSVTSPGSVDTLEQECNGYVRVLVLDPSEPESITVFLRSLASSLSRRFPINAPGDPHASPSAMPYVHSVISLLTLPSHSNQLHPAPFEHISLRDDYLPYLTSTHVTPLNVLQALLPLMRTNPARSRDYSRNNQERKSIIVCLPAMDSRVGLPFFSINAMSAAATLRGLDVLRREIRAAALNESSESMKNLKVVVVDVGVVDAGEPSTQAFAREDTFKVMEGWTASERSTYGPAIFSLLHERPAPSSFVKTIKSLFNGDFKYGMRRRPTDVTSFVNTVASIVGGAPSPFFVGLGPCFERRRYAVGSGARTYQAASQLPTILLDALLNLPYLLMSIHRALLPQMPFVLPANSSSTIDNAPVPSAQSQPTIQPAQPQMISSTRTHARTSSLSASLQPVPPAPKLPLNPEGGPDVEGDGNETDTSSEPDVEPSGAGSGAQSINASWVNLEA